MGIERASARDRRLRLVELAELPQQQARIVVGRDVRGLALDQPLISGERAVDIAPLGQQLGQHLVSWSVVRMERDGAPGMRFGFRGTLGGAQGDCVVAMGRKRIGTSVDHLRQQVDRGPVVLGGKLGERRSVELVDFRLAGCR